MARRIRVDGPRLASLPVWRVGLIAFSVAALHGWAVVQLGVFEQEAVRPEQPARVEVELVAGAGLAASEGATDIATETDTDKETETETETGAEAATEAEPALESQSEPETEPVVEPRLEPDPVPEPESDPKPAPRREPAPEPQPEPEPKSELQPESEAQSEPQPKPESRPEPTSTPPPDPTLGSQSQPGTESQPVSEPAPKPQITPESASAPSTGPAATEDAEGLDNPPPPYPRRAYFDRLTGTVHLRLRIDTNGQVADLEIAESSGHSILDDAAASSVIDWRFKPAHRDGRPVTQWVEVPITFQLE
jgi:protein TonB